MCQGMAGRLGLQPVQRRLLQNSHRPLKTLSPKLQPRCILVFYCQQREGRIADQAALLSPHLIFAAAVLTRSAIRSASTELPNTGRHSLGFAFMRPQKMNSGSVP